MPAAQPFVVAGEALVDVVVPSHGSEECAPGGSPLNVAVGLARLGLDALLITELGDDELGRLVVDHVVSSGARLADDSVEAGRATSTATATLDDNQAATYDFDLSWDLDRHTLPADALGLHVGSIGAALRPGRDAVVDLVGQAVAADVFVSFDPNARPAFLPTPERANADLLEIAASAHLVKMSDEDIEHLAPGHTPEGMAADLLAGSDRTRLVVITHGSTAAEAYARRDTVRVAPAQVEVVDTVGAGDSFMAALIAVVLDWGLELDADQLRMMLAAAHTVAAITCGRRGADPPTRRDLPSAWPAG